MYNAGLLLAVFPYLSLELASLEPHFSLEKPGLCHVVVTFGLHLNTQLQAGLLSTVACRPYLHPLNKSCWERRAPYLDWLPPPLSLCSRRASKSQCEETEFLTL